jgi:cell division protein FtsB
MVQINLFKIYDYIKKYFPYAIIFLLLLFIFKCSGTDELKYEKEKLETQIKENKKLIQNVLKQNKELQKQNLFFENTIAELYEETDKKNEEIAKLHVENGRLKTNIKKFTTDDIVKFYIERYKQPTNVFKTNLGVTFKDTLSKQIAIDLTDYDLKTQELSVTKDIVSTKDLIITYKDSTINNLENQNKNINFVLDEQNSLINNQDDLIKNQESIIKKQTRRNKLMKYAIPISIIGGVFTGVLITK